MEPDHNPLQLIYISRINKAIDYIEANLEKPLTLDDLAKAANFSRFHFSRIFQSLVGETPFQFIQRIRLERAANLLMTRRREPVGSIAMQCGFSDISVFSRNFKKNFGVAASAYRDLQNHKSNLNQQESNSGQADAETSAYFCFQSQTFKWKTAMKQNKSVEVKSLPGMTVAYVRHIGPYQGNANLFGNLWNRLFTWAGPRGLIGGKDFRSLIVYHDDPNVTIEDKLRISVCITVAPDTKVDGEIGKMELEPATYVIARFEVTEKEFQLAWDWVYGQWLPASGYQPDDKPCLEMYPEEPREGIFVVDICVPVKPL